MGIQVRKRLVEQAVSDSDVFKDESTLFPDFVPGELPHREREMMRLAKNFRSILKRDRPRSVHVAVIGDPGVGKTALVKRTMEDLVEVGRDRNVKLDFVYYNCHSMRTKASILRHVLTEKFGVQSRGFGEEEILEMIVKRCEKEDLRLVIGIDEANMLRAEDILSIIHANEVFGSGQSRISTVIISRTAEWRALLNAPLSGHILDQIDIDGYNKDELFDIFKYRAKLAFWEGVISDQILEMVAEISASTRNARHGIEIMLRAGRIADETGDREIKADFIREAKNRVYPELRPDVFYDLRSHELYASLAIARILSRPDTIETTIKDAYQEYQLVVEEMNQVARLQEKPASMATFRQYLSTLEKVGIISMAVKNLDQGRGRRAKITLYDIPAKIMRDRIEGLLKRNPNIR